jgi:hypothetical protein
MTIKPKTSAHAILEIVEGICLKLGYFEEGAEIQILYKAC